jgi:hypothetical protein
MKKLIPILILVLAVGCKTRKTPFSWEGYSESLYNVKENPGKQSVKQHRKVLRSIVKRSNQDKELQVPPGVYAELGYYLIQDNKIKKGKKFLRKEKKLYTESKIFVNRIMDRIDQTQ